MRRRKAIRSQFVTKAKRKNARANIECYAKVKIGDGKIENEFHYFGFCFASCKCCLWTRKCACRLAGSCDSWNV